MPLQTLDPMYSAFKTLNVKDELENRALIDDCERYISTQYCSCTAHKVIFFQFLLLRQIIDDIMSKGQKVITGCLRNKISW